MRIYLDGNYQIIEHENGSVEKIRLSDAEMPITESQNEPTTIEILQDIKDTVDLMYLKAEGVL